MPSVSWYLRRLTAMTPAELGYRAMQVGRAQHDRWQARTPTWPADDELWSGLGQSGTPHWETWAQHAASSTGRFRFGAEATSELRDQFPDEAQALIAEADAIQAGKLVLFGHQPAQQNDPPHWHRDLLTQREWPAGQFAGDIDLRSGGIKNIWEPARHQHLVPLAYALALTGDARYQTCLERQLDSWFQQNSFLRGVHWTSGLELGIRLISWLLVQAIAGDRISSISLWREWTRAVVASGSVLARHQSRYSSANNHLIGEAAGLVAAAVLVPEWRDANAWRARGWTILLEEIEKQILADGVTAEQAVHYEQFVIDFYLLLLAVAPPPAGEGRVWARLHVAGQFLGAISNVRGMVPHIGDDDGGVAWRLSSQELPTASRIALIAAWTGAATAERAPVHPAAWWLTRTRPAIASSIPALPAPSAASCAFPQGGYYVLRSPDSAGPMAVVDCGPLGYLSIAAHGHADCLSVAVAVNGEWLLTDPGTYVYHEAPEWRRHFRGTAAHNTLTVGETDQSSQTGHTMWGARAHARARAFHAGPPLAWIEGEHDGYRRLSPPCVHWRGVGLSASSYLVVIDRLLGGAHDVSVGWQCAPGSVVTIEGNTATIALSGFSYRCHWFFEAAVDVEEGRTDPPRGWVSDKFGRKQPAPHLSCRVRAEAAQPMVTVFWLGADSPEAIDVTADADGATLTVASDGWREHVEWDWHRVSASAGSLVRTRREQIQ